MTFSPPWAPQLFVGSLPKPCRADLSGDGGWGGAPLQSVLNGDHESLNYSPQSLP